MYILKLLVWNELNVFIFAILCKYNWYTLSFKMNPCVTFCDF